MLAKLTAALLLVAAPAFAEAPPVGFQIFCLKNECNRSGASSEPYTAKLIEDLSRVTRSVNGSMRYRQERLEKWSINSGSGDCEDFAMKKRQRLISMGYSPSALRLAVGWTTGGKNPKACPKSMKNSDCIYHAVLVVATSRGKFVLDNLTNEVLPVAKAKLRIRKMASADPKVWG